MEHLLVIKDLSVRFQTMDADVHAVNGIDLAIDAGETLGLVGETGAGKTTTALAILNLIQSPPGKIESGQILFAGRNILEMTDDELLSIRGSTISMIFQDPMTALNPIFRVEDQIAALKDYQPEEVGKLDGAILDRQGTTVLLAVPASHDLAQAALDALR